MTHAQAHRDCDPGHSIQRGVIIPFVWDYTSPLYMVTLLFALSLPPREQHVSDPENIAGTSELHTC